MQELKDVRGVKIEAGDTISIPTPRFGSKGAMHDICTVERVSPTENKIYVDNGEDIDLGMYEILVLPEYYSKGL